MSNTVDSQAYPQFITGNPALARQAGVSCAGFEDFRIYPAVQNRPHSIESWERTPLGILLTIVPAAKTAIPSFTHETPIDLYDNTDATVERLYLHVQLWSDTVFRLIFSKDKEIAEPFAGIPGIRGGVIRYRRLPHAVTEVGRCIAVDAVPDV